MTYETDITVAAIAERDGRFLIIRESTSERVVLNQPGGHIESGETPELAVVRETLEESAWHFEPDNLVGAYLWEDAARQRRYLKLVYCGAAVAESRGTTLDRGILSVHWLTRDDVAARAPELRAPVVLTCIDDYIAGRRLTISEPALHEVAARADREPGLIEALARRL